MIDVGYSESVNLWMNVVLLSEYEVQEARVWGGDKTDDTSIKWT